MTQPKLPSTIKVGPYVFKVLELEGEDANKYMGTFEYNTEEIRLRTYFPSITMAVDTLLHEIMHAIWRVQGVGPKREEITVNALATGLTQVLKDNPALRQYLNEALK